MLLPDQEQFPAAEAPVQKGKPSFKQQAIRIAKSNTARRWIWGILRTILLLGLAFVILFPLISKVSNSLKPAQEVFDTTVVFIPKSPTFDNYLTVIREMNYFRVLGNTVLHSFYLAAIQTVVCTLVAYGFARFKFPGRGILFALVIVTVVIPPQAIAFPLRVHFQYFSPQSLLWISPETINVPHWNLMDPKYPVPIPLLLLSITGVAFKNGLFIFLLRQHFKNIPKELEEAAFIDGASYFKTFYKVMLPGALPLMMTVFLFSFVWTYNDDFYWRTLQTNANVMSLVVPNIATRIMNAMQQGSESSSAATLVKEVYKQAAVMLHILPLVVLYIFTQRFFVQSIERSGLVG